MVGPSMTSTGPRTRRADTPSNRASARMAVRRGRSDAVALVMCGRYRPGSRPRRAERQADRWTSMKWERSRLTFINIYTLHERRMRMRGNRLTEVVWALFRVVIGLLFALHGASTV